MAGAGQALAFSAIAVLIAFFILIAAREWTLRQLTAVAQRWPRLNLERLTQPRRRVFPQFGRHSSGNGRCCAALVNWHLGRLWGRQLRSLLALHAPASWLAAFFLLVVLQLGIAVPSSPGRVGVFHYLSVQALAVFAVGGATAVSFAIILHLISIILPAVLGAALTWKMGLPLTAKADL